VRYLHLRILNLCASTIRMLVVRTKAYVISLLFSCPLTLKTELRHGKHRDNSRRTVDISGTAVHNRQLGIVINTEL
jgi:hypothetical protein